MPEEPREWLQCVIAAACRGVAEDTTTTTCKEALISAVVRTAAWLPRVADAQGHEGPMDREEPGERLGLH